MSVRVRINDGLRAALRQVSKSIDYVNVHRSPAPFVLLERRLAEALVERFVADGAIWCPGVPDLHELALSQVTLDGLVCEFGVLSGRSITAIAERTKGPVHGFDSFEGLPEDWVPGYERGSLSANGKLPEVPANVELHVGWFADTLPDFVVTHDGLLAFMNFDGDLYSSAVTVLDALADRIVPGTVIVFDEYFNFDGWQFGEYRAWQEHTARHHVNYRFIGISGNDPFRRDNGEYGRAALVVTK